MSCVNGAMNQGLCGCIIFGYDLLATIARDYFSPVVSTTTRRATCGSRIFASFGIILRTVLRGIDIRSGLNVCKEHEFLFLVLRENLPLFTDHRDHAQETHVLPPRCLSQRNLFGLEENTKGRHGGGRSGSRLLLAGVSLLFPPRWNNPVGFTCRIVVRRIIGIAKIGFGTVAFRPCFFSRRRTDMGRTTDMGGRIPLCVLLASAFRGWCVLALCGGRDICWSLCADLL